MKYLLALLLFACGSDAPGTTGPDAREGVVEIDAGVDDDAGSDAREDSGTMSCDLSVEPVSDLNCNPAPCDSAGLETSCSCRAHLYDGAGGENGHCYYYETIDAWRCAPRGPEKQLGETCGSPSDCAPGLACHDCKCRTLCYINDPAICDTEGSTCDYWFMDIWGTCR